MMTPWQLWKKGFDTWETQTASYLEQVLQTPLVLEPGGKMLSQMMKTRAATDKAMAQLWSSVGLPTRHDQERLLHAVNMLQSKLIDLEERLHELDEPRHKEG